MARKRWTADEVDKIYDLVCYHGTQEAVRLFLQWQKENPDRDGRDRTFTQVVSKAEDVRVVCPQIDRFSVAQWSRILGVSRNQAYHALQRYTSRAELGYDKGVSTTAVRRVAKRNPFLLCGADREAVAAFLGENYVQYVLDQSPRRTPVKNLDTGKVYPTIAEAAKDVYVHKSTLARSFRYGYKCAGYRWQKIS